jgi:sugar phosphate isomerase/epimerase
MKLGFVSAAFPDLSFEEVVKFAATAGYRCVEFACWPAEGKDTRRYAGVSHIDVAGLNGERIRKIRHTLSSAGVEISALGYYPNPLTPDPAEGEMVRGHLRKVIAAANALEVSVVNTFIGADWKLSVAGNWPRFREIWPALVGYAKEQGVKIAIENCPMLFTKDEWPGGKNLAYSPAISRHMFADIPSPNFGLNYDPSHLVWQMMDYLAPLREFSSRIFHVHAKDVRIDGDHLKDVGILATPLEFHTPKLPGLGEIDWGRFFSVLSDTGYQGAVCVEAEDRAFESSLAMRKAGLLQAKRHLSQFLSAGEDAASPAG